MCWVLDTAFSIHSVSASYFYDRYLYVGNEDFCIRVWNTETGLLYRKLVGHTGLITGFAFSPRYETLFSCGIDGSLITWSGSNMIYKYTHYRPPQNRFPSSMYSIFFNPDSEVIVIGLDCEMATFELSSTFFSQLVPNSTICPFQLRQIEKIHTDRVNNIIGNRRRIFSSAFDRVLCSSQLLDISISKPISRFQTAASCMIFDEMTLNLLVGDHSGVIRAFSADNLSLGPLIELPATAIVSMFYDSCLRLLWFVLSDGTVNLVDTSHPDTFVTEHFPMFKNLPLAGADTTYYEKILGNGLNTRVLAIVNHKYVYTWKWSDTGCCMRISLANNPVNCVLLYNYWVEESQRSKKLRPGGSTSSMAPQVPPPGRRPNSSLVAPGMNIFSAGPTTIACRPLSEFTYTSDDLVREPDVIAMDFSFAEAALICGCRSGKVRMISFGLPKSWTEMHADDLPVTHILCFENMAMSLGADWTMCLWELSQEGLEVVQRRDRAHDCEMTAVCFCESKRLIMTCDVRGFCRIWAVHEKSVKENLLLDHSSYGAITHAVCSQTAGLWMCASTDHYVRGWSVQSPLVAPSFQFCVSPCNVTAMAPGLDNDVYLATDDRTIRLINVRRSDERGLFLGHTQLIRQICVSPTASKFISLQWDGQLYFWLAAPPEQVASVAAGGSSGTARLPRLQKSDALRPTSTTGEEPLISLYEKGRKTLLLKRREGERQLKKMKSSLAWRKMTAIQDSVLELMDDAKRKKSDDAPTRSSKS
jgi:WD40 repeat protein